MNKYQTKNFILNIGGFIALFFIALGMIVYGNFKARNTPDRSARAVYFVLEGKIPRFN